MKSPYEDLKREVMTHSEHMSTAGLALIAIADLLGADVQDHGLSQEHREGLVHAVQAIGYLAHHAGSHLYFYAQDEGVQQ